MEDFSIDNFTLFDYSDDYFDFDNFTYDSIDYDDSTYYDSNSEFIQFVATCIIICIALPLTLVVIYALCRLVRNNHVAPIYIINLLISNLIQLCCLIIEVAQPVIWMTSQTVDFIYHLSLVASVWFMVCVALERYLVIACPLWYSSRRNIKNSVVVCAVVWALALLFVLILYFGINVHYQVTIFCVFLLLPFPLFIFFLGGTLRALSASRVPSDEKRRIVGILVLVLFIYMLLFLPFNICLLTEGAMCNYTFWSLSDMFLRLTSLVDLTLYVFMKKGTIDKLLSSVCCCRMDSSDISSSPV